MFVGIVLVPFTWWFVQFVISVGTFTTSAVLQIPAETINRLDDKNAFWTTESIPKEITVDTIFRTYDAIKADCKEKGNCISPKNFVMEGGGIYSPILAYAYSIFKIDKLKVINTNAVDLTMNITSLFSDLMIAGIMFVIFGIIVIALVAILFVRVVILWLYAMFSPLFTFQYVFGGKL